VATVETSVHEGRLRNELRFDGRVVLVTGAANGLGRAYALAFAERGAHVVVNDMPAPQGSTSEAQALVDAMRSRGASALAVPASVLDADRIVGETLAHYGRLDVLVNNAGILRDAAFHKMTTAQWDAVLDVHLEGAFLVTRAAWPHLRSANYGRVVMTSSCAGLLGNFGQANYAAAKSGLVGLAQTLAIEGARHDIRVNVIAPLAASRLTQGILPAALYAALKPEHVVPVVLALSHETCIRTGQIFEVGGGHAWRLRWQRSAIVDLEDTVFNESEALDRFDESREIESVGDSMARLAQRLGLEFGR
jgi:3-hydroxyacyl-CoA dehydrogenase/3a,7a,12a-trihydroxy-5b-cholest-24-enoyl-CoA hydratase